VCINEEDQMEKTSAIGSMDVVYKSARLIVILLEDIQLNESSEDDHELIRRLKLQDYDFFVEAEARALARVFSKMLRARWFSRAWCSQGYILCKDHIFVVPLSQGYQKIINSDMSWLFLAASRDLNAEDTAKFKRKNLSLFIQKNMSRMPLMRLFRATAELDSFYFRDRISISLNISGVGLYYSSNILNYCVGTAWRITP
jgi:hypothetical protein